MWVLLPMQFAGACTRWCHGSIGGESDAYGKQRTVGNGGGARRGRPCGIIAVCGGKIGPGGYAGGGIIISSVRRK
uniref:Uncharacterized protein n=1 Tax=Bracon brevicornis TaxID=1563983 RepID=A0A6V7LKF4_9HYME